MTNVRKLKGNKTYLSPLTPDHASLWYRWHGNMETALLAGVTGCRTPGSLQEMRQDIEQGAKFKAHGFLISDCTTDQPIGWCTLYRVDPISQRAILGIVIGEKGEWSKGYGQDALQLLLDYGFSILNLNSIELHVVESNKRAIRCYEKLGFQVVGRHREARINGMLKQDNLVMDILASEFVSPVVQPMIERSGH